MKETIALDGVKIIAAVQDELQVLKAKIRGWVKPNPCDALDTPVTWYAQRSVLVKIVEAGRGE